MTGTLSRRELLASTARTALAGVALSVPTLLTQARWATAASAQTSPTVTADFEAMVAAINGVPDDDPGVAPVAAWIIAEFDKALPPLPNGSPSAAVAAVLDAYALQAGGAPTFSTADTAGRHAALRAMVLDPDPSIRQLANQVLPFSSFAYWGDVVLGEPAVPGGPRPPQWDVAGYLGPSHGRLDTFQDGSPSGFAPMTDFDA
ncbi:MAG: hypothetical protein KY461_11485 [Actinobacteria bacterium]|nr:hypothetical protein [Actinomycetota bacterium]